MPDFENTTGSHRVVGDRQLIELAEMESDSNAWRAPWTVLGHAIRSGVNRLR